MTSSPRCRMAYDPRAKTRAALVSFWEREGLFHASADRSERGSPYTVAVPPPNDTGFLHMGHACRVTFEDVLTRYHRMLGRNALWVPGTDQAGIATQVVVERLLAREGKTRLEIGRPGVRERVWKWRARVGRPNPRAAARARRSCDWSPPSSRHRFRSRRAVTESFVLCTKKSHLPRQRASSRGAHALPDRAQ